MHVSMSEQNLPVPPELECLSTFIDSHPECIAGSSKELRSIALCATKHIFDWALETEKSAKPHLSTLLSTLTQSAPPQTRWATRSNTSTQVRDSSPLQKQVDVRETPLPSLLIEGMNNDQIWQQLDLRAARICANLRVLQGDDEEGHADLEGEDSDDVESEDEDEDAQMDINDEDLWEEHSSEEEAEGSATEGVADLQEDTSEDEEDDEPPTSMLDVIHSQQQNTSKAHSQGSLGLNDGFFDLASFNAETDEMEKMEVTKRKLNFVTDEDSTEESDVDLFGSVDDSTIKEMDDSLNIFYADFFKPPRGTQNKTNRLSKVRFHERVSVKKIKAVGKGLPLSFMDKENSEE